MLQCVNAVLGGRYRLVGRSAVTHVAANGAQSFHALLRPFPYVMPGAAVSDIYKSGRSTRQKKSRWRVQREFPGVARLREVMRPSPARRGDSIPLGGVMRWAR